MKLRHFMFAATLSLLTFAACGELSDPVNPDDLPEVYTVKLDCGGELDINQVPLTRFTPDNNDLYGINVYYMPVSGGTYKHYAYGLFDDLSNATIDLIADYKFKFEVDLIDDGKSKVYSDGIQIEEVNYTGYGYPFQAYNNYDGTKSLTITKISNAFTYSEVCYFHDLGQRFQIPGSTSSYCEPEGVETYYGVAEVVPTADGETVSVFLKRMVYGIKVVAGDFLTEGTVKVSFASGNVSPSFTLSPDNKVVENIYTTLSRPSWYKKEELEDAYSYRYMNFSWTKDDGTVLKLKEQTVKVNRLKQTIINLTFYEDTTIDGAKLAVQYEDQVFVEEGQEIYSFGDDQSEYEW